MFRTALTVAATLVLVTLNQATAQSGPAIQSGTYDLDIAFGGGLQKGTLVITRVGDNLDAKLTVGDHDSPVRPARRDGARLTLQSGPGIQIRYELEFKGDDVAGTFIYQGESGSVTGKRRRSGG
jgi:hypothetical protein